MLQKLTSLLLASSLPLTAADLTLGWNARPGCVDTVQTKTPYGWADVATTQRLYADSTWLEADLSSDSDQGWFRVKRVNGPLSTVTYAWDPSPTPDVIEYVLYGRRDMGYYEIARVPATETTLTVRNPESPEFVMVCARNGVLESDPSNEIESPLPTPPTGLFLKQKSALPITQQGGWYFRDTSVRNRTATLPGQSGL
jgi:hypothetical protein